MGGMMRGKVYRRSIIFILILNMISVKIIYGGEIKGDKFLGKTKAIVTDVLSTKEIIEDNNGINSIKQELNVLIRNGTHKGEKIVIENIVDYSESKEFLLHKGDRILISIQERDGKVVKGYLYEFQRDKYLVYLIICCIALMIIIGGLEGVKSLLAVVLTLIFILGILPTVIIKGYIPQLVFVSILLVVVISVLIIIGGINRGTYASIIGTILGGTITGVIFKVMSNIARLSEYNDLENQALIYYLKGINVEYKELLFIATLMGIIGVLMNITTVISTTMRETEELNPKIGTLKLMKKGMHVGRRLIGTSIIILILVYIAVSFDFTITVFTYKISFIEVVNQSIVVSAVIRVLAASIGLIISVPITVGVYGIFREKALRK